MNISVLSLAAAPANQGGVGYEHDGRAVPPSVVLTYSNKVTKGR